MLSKSIMINSVSLNHKSKSLLEQRQISELDIDNKSFIRGIGNRLSSDSSLKEEEESCVHESEQRLN